LTLRADAYHRTIAEEALARVGCTEPPVPVDALVATLGIPVRSVNLPHFFTGAIIYEDGLPVIMLNSGKPEPERRRALAHMLGHILLVLHAQTSGYPRDTGPHTAADSVAREIMVPASLVAEQARLWFNDYRYLARMFGVSETEMLDRMRELGLIKGLQGVMWDY
jgi:Zn-dependent peptidase ImmA (M78 family)